jgi:hypothetical protein
VLSLAYIYAALVKLKLPICPDFIVALAAIYGSAFTGFKRYFGILTTLGTYRGEHLAGSVAIATTTTVTLCLPCLAASRASLGLIGVAFGLEELLLLGTESEGSSAIGTFKCLVLKSQRMTSFLQLVG